MSVRSARNSRRFSPPTIDITTGQYPVIESLRTVVTAEELLGVQRRNNLKNPKRELYATPLTDLAVRIAVINAADTNGNAVIDPEEFMAALDRRGQQSRPRAGSCRGRQPGV